MTKSKYKNREQWLEAAVGLLTEKLFKPAGYTVPKVRVSCGWPSSRGLGSSKWAAGECWAASAAEDKVSQIFISPRVKEALGAWGVLGILVHEICHAVVGNKAGHGPVFRKCALAVGLTGKMTKTTAGDELLEKAKAWLKVLGGYPHSALRPGQRPVKKQTTRMVLCKCKECGYQCRTSRKWLDDVGAPLCPCNEKPMGFEIPKELESDDDNE